MKLSCLLLFTCVVMARAQVIYTVQDLGTLGGTISLAAALNNSGQAAGSSYLGTEEVPNSFQNAFITGANGELPMQNLGTLGGTQSFGQAINVSGIVVGHSQIVEGETTLHAFLSGPNGGPLMDLGTLGGFNSYGYGVNGAGQVSGYAYLTGNNGPHAFFKGASDTGLSDLGTLPGGSTSFGGAMNASGQVTGYAETTNEFQAQVNHAFISEANGGALRDLGTLGGNSSFGIAVNGSGQVVGRSETGTGDQHAFRSEPNGGPLLDLGSLGGRFSVGQGINDAGTVVGYYVIRGTFDPRAFVYSSNYGMLNLNFLIAADSGWVLTDAKAINDAGQIVGQGTNRDGETHGYLLTLVPATARKSAISEVADGHFVVTAIGTPYRTYTLEVAATLTAGFEAVASVTADQEGILRYDDAPSIGTPRRFYRFVYP